MNYTVTIDSRGRVSGTASDYVIQFPALPPGKYRACCEGFFGGYGAQGMVQVRCADISRSLSTKSSNDGWTDILPFCSVLAKTRLNSFIYFDDPPDMMEVRFIATSTGAVYALGGEKQIVMHFEKM